MKKPIMKKEDLDKEYMIVNDDQTCHVPLLEATKILNLKPGTLPTIKMKAADLRKTIQFVENERAIDLDEYQNHIFLIREKLITQDYSKVKDKLEAQFKLGSSQKKDPEVGRFVNNCVFLEVDKIGAKLKWVPMILGEAKTIEGSTLH